MLSVYVLALFAAALWPEKRNEELCSLSFTEENRLFLVSPSPCSTKITLKRILASENLPCVQDYLEVMNRQETTRICRKITLAIISTNMLP